MLCSECLHLLNRARLDVYWCGHCEKAWLLKPLRYKTYEEAACVGVPPNRRIEK